MLTVQFSTNGQKYPLPHSTLLEMAGDIASHAATQPELFRELSALNIPSVTEALADHVDVDDIPLEMADRMWQEGNNGTRKSLLRDRSFLQRITRRQLDDVLKANDEGQLAIVARNFEFDAEDGLRLNGKEVEELYKRLRAMPEREIRKALASNDNLPDSAEGLTLKERIALDAVRTDDYAVMSLEDVELFCKADSDALGSLAYNVDEIEDRSVRKAVTRMFMEHEDPTYRQEMADNHCMPRDVLKLLARCDDPIAVAYAEMTLEAKDED